MDEFLYMPVAAHYWKHHELWDGTYTIDDLFDIVEVIAVQRENEARYSEYVRNNK